MAKSRSARLSLTMPDSFDVHADPAGQRVSGDNGDAEPSNLTSQRHGGRIDKLELESKPDTRGARSVSPATAPLTAKDRPKTPTSPRSPGLTSLPPFPPSPVSTPPRHARDQSKSFFSNLKASKSSAKIQPAEPTIRKVSQEPLQLHESTKKPSRTKSTPDLRGATVGDPVPDLPTLDSNSSHLNSIADHKIPRRPVGTQALPINTVKSTAVGPTSPIMENSESKKNGLRFPNFMKRNHSNRSEDLSSSSKPGTPTVSKAPDLHHVAKPPSRDHSTGRNPSPLMDSDDLVGLQTQLKDQRSQSFRDGAGSMLFHGLRHTTGKAVEGLGKAHNKFFKQSKPVNGSSSRQIEPVPNYEVKVINLPLREQTRITRIAKRLEDSKDKTEFWMPALPWRCIDFLNFNGCEVEGLYRVPGSDREVKLWKQKFDQQYDINLFDQDDLYDVNTVGSLFKAWLRELPDEIFSSKVQDELAIKYKNEEKAPQELKDILSNLPPWNYYLLFAITCHLSLLNAYQDKNKMTFTNLFICFSPALKMNSECFRWLVGDWRSCWKGCLTEKDALEDEYRLLDGETGMERGSHMNQDRKASFSSAASAEPIQARPGSSSARNQGASTHQKNKTRHVKDTKGVRSSPGRSKDDLALSLGSGKRSVDESCIGSATPSHNRSASQLPELSFPQPISPIFASHS